MNDQLMEALKDAVLNSKEIYSPGLASLLMREFGPKVIINDARADVLLQVFMRLNCPALVVMDGTIYF
jgi:hypothetical protein